jgi:hypothetical protein
MHDTALKNGDLFFKTYVNSKKPIKILDLGSQDVNGALRAIAPKTAEYIGVDFANGKGVDIKITDPYKLPFKDNFFDMQFEKQNQNYVHCNEPIRNYLKYYPS